MRFYPPSRMKIIDLLRELVGVPGKPLPSLFESCCQISFRLESEHGASLGNIHNPSGCAARLCCVEDIVEFDERPKRFNYLADRVPHAAADIHEPRARTAAEGEDDSFGRIPTVQEVPHRVAVTPHNE